MTRAQQREKLAVILASAKDAGLKIKWSGTEIVVIGLLPDDGSEQETGDQPLHGEAGEEGR